MTAASPTKLDAALAHAAAGVKVFPIIPNGKLPAVEEWQRKATTNKRTIRTYWTAHPNANIGGFMDDWTAIDVDTKNGKPGKANFEALALVNDDWPETWISETPSGGEHHIYKGKGATTANRLAQGIDTRGGEKGYVLLPGSTIDGKPYQWRQGAGPQERKPAKLPAWVADQLAQANQGPAKAGEIAPGVDLDHPANIQRATEYLQTHAPEAIESAGGDTTTLLVALRVKDFGVSESMALDLMLEHWNEEKASPPWDPDELAVKVKNAYLYGRNAIGEASPQADFGPVEDPNNTVAALLEPKSTRPALFFERSRDIKIRTDTAFLVDGLLDTQAMSVIYGESNTGKTFIAIDISFAIAAGREWMGKKTRKGAVVYVAAEAGNSARKRVQALKITHNLEDFPLYLVPCPVDLLHKNGDLAPLVELIRDVEADAGCKVELVVIDTLSRAMAGGNENDSADMGALVANLDRVRNAVTAHLMVIHHSGKDKARGARGHSSLRAATDTEIEIVDNTIRATKQRDMDGGQAMGFALRTVEIATRDDGAPITSCVVEPATVGDATQDFESLDLSPAEIIALRTLGDLAVRVGEIEAGAVVVRGKEWRDAVWDGVAAGGSFCAPNADAFRMAMKRARDSLIKKQRVQQAGNDRFSLVG